MCHTLGPHHVGRSTPAPNHINQPSTGQHMKLKYCGVQWNNILCVQSQYHEKCNDELVGLNVLLHGTSTVVTNTQRDCHEYQVVWATDGSLSSSFDNEHFCTKFNKGYEDAIKGICSSQIAYEKKYPEATAKTHSVFAKMYQQLLTPLVLAITLDKIQATLRNLYIMCSHNKNASINYSNHKHTYCWTI